MQAIAPSTGSKSARLESATYSLRDFSSLLGTSYTQCHEMAQAGTLPVAPIRVGRLYRFPKSAVHRLLGIDPTDQAA